MVTCASSKPQSTSAASRLPHRLVTFTQWDTGTLSGWHGMFLRETMGCIRGEDEVTGGSRVLYLAKNVATLGER